MKYENEMLIIYDKFILDDMIFWCPEMDIIKSKSAINKVWISLINIKDAYLLSRYLYYVNDLLRKQQ